MRLLSNPLHSWEEGYESTNSSSKPAQALGESFKGLGVKLPRLQLHRTYTQMLPYSKGGGAHPTPTPTQRYEGSSVPTPYKL